MHIATTLYWLIALLIGTASLAMAFARWLMTRSADIVRLFLFLSSFYLTILAAFLKVLLLNDRVPGHLFDFAAILSQILIAIALPRWTIGHQPPENPLPDIVLPISIAGLILIGVSIACEFLGTEAVWAVNSAIASGFMIFCILYALLVQIGREKIRTRLLKTGLSLVFMIPLALDMLHLLPGNDPFAPFGLRVLPSFYAILNLLFMGDFVVQYRNAGLVGQIKPAANGAREQERPEAPTILEHFDLSPRELEVAALIVAYASYKEIGEKLSISLPTVKTHASNIYRKAGAANRRELQRLLS